MDRRPADRALAIVVAVAALVWLAGCTRVVAGHAQMLGLVTTDVPAGRLPVTGAGNDPIDTRARNALADLQAYWSSQFPAVFGKDFTSLQGGYFSVDPGHVDPADYPQGVGCGTDPQELKNNAFYCQEPGKPNSDSISYDRAFLAKLADTYGDFLPDLVMAHEFGHAVQARTTSPASSIATETQADCYAGAWTKWVAQGRAAHTSIRAAGLDQVLRGYLLLRDPVGTSSSAQMAHGSFFDRVSAFQDGFDSGPAACRDDFGPGRVFTQGTFSDADVATNGNAPYRELPTLMKDSFPQFWQAVFSSAFHEQFRTPRLQPFDNSPPACAKADLDLVYCRQDAVVGYDEPDLTKPAYANIGDFAVVTAVSIPYGLDARDQLGLSAHDPKAYESAICLSGWYAAQVFAGNLSSVRISPGDLDESVQFLLEYGRNPKVLPGVRLSGFELVDLFRQGFLQGGAPCGIGR